MQVMGTPSKLTHGHDHRFGVSATRPSAPHCGTLAALLSQGQEALAFGRHKQSSGLFVSGLSLAGTSPQRRRALPAHRITAHSAVSNCRF